MTRPLAIIALLLASGCATVPDEAPTLPPAPPTLAAVDADARGRVGQIVMLDGETFVGVRFAEVGPDSVRGTVGAGEPLAVATADVREIVLISRQAADIGPVALGVLAALPPLACLAVNARSESRSGSTCSLDDDDYSTGEFVGLSLCAGASVFAVTTSALPPPPRRADTVIPIAPLSRFADAPRAGVGLWRSNP